MYAEHKDDLPTMSVAEYLAFADDKDSKYEHKAGRVYAMAGASVRHNTIVASTVMHLGNLLNDRDCTVNASDTRVKIKGATAFRYPDVTVFCDDPAYWEQRVDTITNPVILVEVLSPGTAVSDYNEKLEEYVQLKSLQVYIIIAQDKPKIEVYWRDDAGKWTYEIATELEATLEVPALDRILHLTLAQIYRRVRWEDDK